MLPETFLKQGGTISRIGLLADTHSNRNDGSDLPDGVLEAFAKVDLIVHLGDIGARASSTD